MPTSPDCALCQSPNFSGPCFRHQAFEDIHTLDQLWDFVWRWLTMNTGEHRERASRTLMRRLRHPEAGYDATVGLGLNQREIEREHFAQRHPKLLRHDSAPCICGARRADHDEDGSYSPTGCDLYTPVAS